jgi:predicted MFS family arabinose efflux permease
MAKTHISRSVRRFIGFQSASILGDRIAQVSVPLAILTVTGSPSAAGIVAAANQLPGFLTAAAAGSLADRRSRKVLSISSDLGRAVLYLLLAVMLLSNTVNLFLVVVVMFVIGVLDTVAGISHYAWLPELAGDRELIRANELLEGGDAAVTIIGPPIGGVLIDFLGRSSGVLANAFSFLISAAGLASLPRDHVATAESVNEPGASFSGLRLIASNGTQRGIQLMYTGTFATTGALVLIALTAGYQKLSLRPSIASLAVSGAGVGGLLAAFVLAPRLRDLPLRRVCTAIYVSVTVSFLIVASASNIAALFAAMMVADCAITMSFIVLGTLRQSITSGSALGQVAGMSAAINSLIATVAAAAAGLSMRLLGVGTTATIWAVLIIPAVVGSRMTRVEGRSLVQVSDERSAISQENSVTPLDPL